MIRSFLPITHNAIRPTTGTSLKVSPSGNFLWGGFSDGTLRVWDLSGTFGVEDDDVIASRQKTDVLVNSKLSQGYGAVACQIHARGVHTDLITTVDISDDAQYVFVGVARGAMELHAVFVGDLERAVHTHKEREHEKDGRNNNHHKIKRNILDYIKVYCHSDAKLKGFGACATMRVARSAEQRINPCSSTPYLLLTGKGIKNIHIWKFTPPEHPNSEEDDELNHTDGRNRKQSICEHPDDDEDHGTWDQLYDTSTNGNTIVLLAFYRNPQNKLLAVSKSDAQKLRLWDLSFEEDASTLQDDSRRPKRPPYKDVANSQFALEVAGGIGVCGGGNMYNEMSIVSLDKPDDPFNHTELALPTAHGAGDVAVSSRRQRRGEMKAVANVATSPRDSSHALLELDDVSYLLSLVVAAVVAVMKFPETI
jgi:WD40 repeat protein